MTVLKNEKSVLPLDGKSLKTIAVIGTQAATPAVRPPRRPAS
jgi:beta-glucosidase-like glycosyl hydrolase